MIAQKLPLLTFNRIHVDVSYVDGTLLDINKFREWKPEHQNAFFVCDDGSLNVPSSFGGIETPNGGKYICGSEVEKCPNPNTTR
jgi:hypothetical protein